MFFLSHWFIKMRNVFHFPFQQQTDPPSGWMKSTRSISPVFNKLMKWLWHKAIICQLKVKEQKKREKNKPLCLSHCWRTWSAQPSATQNMDSFFALPSILHHGYNKQVGATYLNIKNIITSRESFRYESLTYLTAVWSEAINLLKISLVDSTLVPL